MTQFNTYDVFLESFLSDTLKVERLESQIILKILGPNRTIKIAYGHISLREECLCLLIAKIVKVVTASDYHIGLFKLKNPDEKSSV